jgi:prepilin-type N-terminal cleavage/methylation domain-containing protein
MIKIKKIEIARRGFTLIELLVAIGLFAIVVSIAAGGITRMLRTQRQVLSLISANSNASLAIEQIAREIRTGFDFCVNGNNCASSSQLTFTNANADQVSYDLIGGAIERSVNGGAFSPLTASNISIQRLSFSLFGNNPSDGYPPRITVSIGVSPKAIGVSNVVTNLETTISARQIDT